MVRKYIFTAIYSILEFSSPDSRIRKLNCHCYLQHPRVVWLWHQGQKKQTTIIYSIPELAGPGSRVRKTLDLWYKDVSLIIDCVRVAPCRPVSYKCSS